MYILNKNFLLSIFMMLRSFYCLFCQDTSIQNSRGTTVVMYVSKDSIVLGADSKSTVIKNDKIIATYNHLKIKSSKNIFYSVAGDYVNLFKHSGDTLFNAENLIYKVISNYKKGFIDQYNRSKQAIIKKLDEVYIVAPKTWKNNMESKVGIVLLQVLMVTNENSNLNYKSFEVGIFLRNGKYKFECVDKNIKYSIPKLYCIGSFFEIQKRINNSLYIFDAYKVKDSLIELIKLEEKANPDKVGPPYDILVISKNNARWLTNNKY